MFKKIQELLKVFSKYEYAKASVYYVIANIIGQGVVLLSSAIFTRMMNKTDYGLISTYSTWVLVLNTFIGLNLFITVRNAYIDFTEDYDRYVSSVLLLSLQAGVILTVVIVGINALMDTDFSTAEVLLACIQSVALNVVNYKLAVQAMRNQYKQRFVLMVAPNWTHTILSIILMLIFTGNLYLAKISGNAFGLLFFAILCVVAIFRVSAPKIISSYWKYSLKISLPSIFNTLSDLILMQCDRLMLTSMVGAAETAEYSVVYNVSSIIVAIYQAINGAWTPLFYKLLDKGDKDLARKYQNYYLIVFTVFSCGMMTISPELIKIISPREYWNGIRYAGAIVVASYVIFLYAFLTVYLMFEKKTGIIARNTIIAAGVNIFLNYFLIPDYKAIGSVGATLVSYIILFLLHYFSVGKEGKQYLAVADMWKHLFIMMGYAVIYVFTKDLWLIRYGVFILTAIIVVIRYRKEIAFFVKNAKEKGLDH